MELLEITEISGTMTLKTGLHIGCGDLEMRIGGTDSPVVKHPYTLEPYIPGSSLKGKVRALLEMQSGLMLHSKGAPLSDKAIQNCHEPDKQERGKKIMKLFGTAGSSDDENKEYGPTRVSFGDCPVSEKWKTEEKDQQWPLTEIKAENTIDRIKGTAAHPRFIERVPSGVQFDFSIRLKQFDSDQDLNLRELLLKGLKLLSLDALGGSGSRGYGQVNFQFDNPSITKQFNDISF